MAYTDKITWMGEMFRSSSVIEQNDYITNVDHITLDPRYGHALGSEKDGIGCNYVMLTKNKVKIVFLLYVPTAEPYIDPYYGIVLGTFPSTYCPSYNYKITKEIYTYHLSNFIRIAVRKSSDENNVPMDLVLYDIGMSSGYVNTVWGICFNYGD